MKPILTADEYRRIDKAYGGDLIVAMDKAGYAVALAAVRAGAGYGKKVVVLAGPGNNGGDGHVAARYLHRRGAHVEIHALAPPKTPEAIDAAVKAQLEGARVLELGDVQSADVVIDALFGGGVRGDLPDAVKAWMNTAAPVVAVDYPTGMDPDTGAISDQAFRAVETVTFSTLKVSHVRGPGVDHCGTVTVADIGINGGRPCLFLAEESDAPRPARPREAHKWSAGTVLVVGGSDGIVGASVFAGRSALNFGAGAVVVASPNADTVHEQAPQLPTFQLSEAESRLDRFDVVVVGPGLAEPDYPDALPIIAKAGRVVLDAGGLTPELVDAAREGDAQVIATPHVGELKRISGGSAGMYATRALARKRGITILRKGNPTLITSGDLPIAVTSGGPELASIGTGDVLAGMIGALWARGLEPLEAAVSGAYWHGVAAADLARTQTVTADVLADHISGFAW